MGRATLFGGDSTTLLACDCIQVLARSAHLAEKGRTRLTLDAVDRASCELEEDRYISMIRTAPVHLQATMGGIIEAWRNHKGVSLSTGDSYAAYRDFCRRAATQPVTVRAFGDLVSELGIYGYLRERVLSRGRYGRSRDIVVELSAELTQRIQNAILLNFGLRKTPADA